MFPYQTILVVAAHPDDEVLGCGGTVARLAEAGAVITTLILGEGITSRSSGTEGNNEALKVLKAQAQKANRIVGASEVVFCDFPDNRFDTVPLLEVVKNIENEINRIHPEAIFTHHGGDLNVDHRIAHRAVLTAARPLPEMPVKAVFAFEVLSSSEWPGPHFPFVPNMWVDITPMLPKKIRAMESYAGEIREFPHPRSREGIEALARKRGSEAGVQAAEAFEIIRVIA